MIRDQDVLIIVPAFNEAANLPSVIEALRRVGPRWDTLLVDDGSTDETAEVARGLGLLLAQHPRNRGYGAALATGYRYALERSYQAVVQTDADGQHDPADIPRLLATLGTGCDVAIGSRMLTDQGYRPSVVRGAGIRLFAQLGRALTGTPITDPTSGFAAMSRRAVGFLAEATPRDYPDLNILVLLHRAGFVTREIPVTMSRRRSGRSMTGGLRPFVYVPKMLYYLGRACTDPVVPVAPVSVADGGAARRVLLINPPTGLYIREDRCQTPVKGISAALRAPIDLAYMAATARERGAAPLVRDYPAEGLDQASFIEDLHTFRPQVLVLSTISPTLEWDLQCCEAAKQVLPSVLTVVKGAHVTVRAREVLEAHAALDVVIRGESEVAAGEIAGGRPLDQIPGLTFRTPAGIRETAARPFAEDLDALPFPARDLLRNELYIRPDTRRPQTTIQASWGCPHRCIYCLAPQVSGHRLRVRSPGNVLAEIDDCIERFGIRDFYFRADTFTQKRRWVIELCEGILGRGLEIRWGCNSRVDSIDPELLELMRRAGCWIIGFGVESGSDEILERVRKGATVAQARRALAMCRDAGIKAYAFFMVGFPWETEETAEQTLELIRTIGADFIEINVPVPFPGTALADEVERAGLLEAPLLGHDHSKPTIRPYAMSRDQVSAYWRNGLLGFYGRPLHLLRLLQGVGSAREVGNYVRWGGRFFWRLVTRRQ